MSVKLIVEVLDHYHGPHARKLWLIAWAEKVSNDGSRAGYCKREVLAARLGVSVSRASHIARELEVEGTIKRLGGGVWGKAAVYELLPLDASQGDPGAHPMQGDPRAHPMQGDPRAHPMQGDPRAHPMAEPGPHSQGDPRAHSQGDPRAHPNPDPPHKPSSASRRTTRTGSGGARAATDDDDDSSTQPADLDGGAEGAPAPVQDRPGPGYGLCPVCRDWQIVQGYGGSLRRHNADIRGGRHWCPGSGREPVEPVPCVGCGRTDVALTGNAGLCYACRRTDDEAPW